MSGLGCPVLTFVVGIWNKGCEILKWFEMFYCVQWLHHTSGRSAEKKKKSNISQNWKQKHLKKIKYLSQSTLKYWRFWSIANTLLYRHINNSAPSFLICLSILHKTPPLHCGFPFLDCYVHLKKRVPNYSKLRFFNRFTHINKAKT